MPVKGTFHKLFRIGEPGRLPDDPVPLLRLGFFIIVVFILGGLAWIALAPLEGAIVGNGVVKVRNERVPIQHPKGGVVAAMHVKDGMPVKAGQALFEISEPTRVAGFQASRYQHVSEVARNARLRSEQMLGPRVVFPQAVLSRVTDAEVVAIIVAVLLAMVAAHFIKQWYRKRGTGPAEVDAGWQAALIEGCVLLSAYFLALVFLLALRAALSASSTDVTIIDIFMQLIVALLIVRLGVYLLRLVLGGGAGALAYNERQIRVIGGALGE